MSELGGVSGLVSKGNNVIFHELFLSPGSKTACGLHPSLLKLAAKTPLERFALCEPNHHQLLFDKTSWPNLHSANHIGNALQYCVAKMPSFWEWVAGADT